MIEILVVVTIIGLLAALVITKVSHRVGQAKTTVAAHKIAQIEQQIVLFKTDTGRYPSEDEGLAALVEAPDDLEGKWHGPYIDKKGLLDPWEHPFVYHFPGQRNPDFDLFSLGEDGQESEDDIGNW